MRRPVGYPRKLARFYGNLDYGLEAIRSRTLSFVRVTKLNDPFDPYFFFETDFDDNFRLILEYIGKHRPSDFGLFIQRITPDEWKNIVRNIKNFLDKQRNSTFMLSLIETDGEDPAQENLLMWSHYGNGHRGMLIEFDIDRLYESVLATNEIAEYPVNAAGDVLLRVEYKDIFFPISIDNIIEFYLEEGDGNFQSTKLAIYFRGTLNTKYKKWSYEREWRMLWENDNTRSDVQSMKLLDDAISSVYIGLCTSDDARNDIITATRANFPNAKVLEAAKSHGRFGLTFRQVNCLNSSPPP